MHNSLAVLVESYFVAREVITIEEKRSRRFCLDVVRKSSYVTVILR